jgi:hypothetical protein
MPDGSADQNNAYLPKANPLDENSKDVEVKLFRLTGKAAEISFLSQVHTVYKIVTLHYIL